MLSPEELKMLVVPDIEPVKVFVQKALHMKAKVSFEIVKLLNY